MSRIHEQEVDGAFRLDYIVVVVAVEPSDAWILYNAETYGSFGIRCKVGRGGGTFGVEKLNIITLCFISFLFVKF